MIYRIPSQTCSVFFAILTFKENARSTSDGSIMIRKSLVSDLQQGSYKPAAELLSPKLLVFYSVQYQAGLFLFNIFPQS